MTENVENLLLEQLRLLRNEVKSQGIKSDEQFQTLALRLSSIEERLTLLERAVINIHGDIGAVHVRLDRLDGRTSRIERRLDLNETV
jgi:predicted  nucleic acid-binding Zn-ribbon protein